MKGNAFEGREFQSTILFFDHSTKIFELEDKRFIKKRKNQENIKIVINIPFLEITDTADVLDTNLFLDKHGSKIPKGNYILTEGDEEYILDKL